MIPIPADHPASNIIKPFDKCGIGIIKLPAGNTFDNQQTILIAGIQKSRITRIMGGTDGIVAPLLQVDRIPYLHRIGSGITDIGKSLVTVGSAHIQFFSIDKETLLRCVTDCTDTDFFLCLVQYFFTG